MSTSPILQANDMSAGYGARTVLHNLSFDVAPGEMIGLIGPNGAGKTTLLRVIAGDLTPVTGAIVFQAQPLTALSHRMRARAMAYVPPALELMATMTVMEFVSLGRTPYVTGWQRFKPQDRDAVDRALALADLTAFTERTIHELSEGEKHRAMIALGLAQEPQLLLLDEPTAHLDIKHAWEVMELIYELHQSRAMTMVLATHDLNIAAEFCSRLFLMEDGRVVAEGVPVEVLDETRLSAVYDYPVSVLKGPASVAPRVFPRRR